MMLSAGEGFISTGLAGSGFGTPPCPLPRRHATGVRADIGKMPQHAPAHGDRGDLAQLEGECADDVCRSGSVIDRQKSAAWL
jgi:hypothetical protein